MSKRKSRSLKQAAPALYAATGAAVGATIGFVIGGPIGAGVGAALSGGSGGFAGGLVEKKRAAVKRKLEKQAASKSRPQDCGEQ